MNKQKKTMRKKLFKEIAKGTLIIIVLIVVLYAVLDMLTWS